MIRAAKFVDIPRIVDLLYVMLESSKYAGKTGIDRKAAQALIQQCVVRHGGKHDGGALFNVVEHDGVVEGFMIGLLDRVYHIGEKLAANDLYLYVTDKASKLDALRLFKAYVEWALSNPKVYEVRASWTNTMEGAQKVAGLYKAEGFQRCGEIWERVVA